MNDSEALQRNCAIVCAIPQIVNKGAGWGDEPMVDKYIEAAESLGLICNLLAEDGGSGHCLYGVFYGAPFTDRGVMVAIIHEDSSGAAYVVRVYPTDDYSTAQVGPLVEPLPIKLGEYSDAIEMRAPASSGEQS